MSERYIPPEARGVATGDTQTVKIPHREIKTKGWLRQRAEQALQALVIMGTLVSAERVAQAEDPPAKPEAREQFKFDQSLEQETPEGTVSYRQGTRDAVIEGIGGQETITRVQVVDEGDPKVKGDELTVARDFYRFDGEHEDREWVTKPTASSGTMAPDKNPFGHIDGFPESIRRAPNPNSARTRANHYLQGYAFELRILHAIGAVGKADTPEATYLRTQLREKVKVFREHHPDVAVAPGILTELGVEGI